MCVCVAYEFVCVCYRPTKDSSTHFTPPLQKDYTEAVTHHTVIEYKIYPNKHKFNSK